MAKELKIVNQNKSTAEIYLYGIIGRYWDIDVQHLVPALEKLKNEGITHLTFYVHSEGGEVHQGIALFQYLERSGFNVTWIVDGIAASMAFMVMLHRNSTIKLARYSKVMAHRVGGMVQGNADEVRNYADQMEQWEADLVDILADRCKMSPEAVKTQWFDGKDHWLTAKEMEAIGLASIVDLREGVEPAPENITTAEAYSYYNRIFNLKPQNDMKNSGRFVATLSTLPGHKAIEDAENEDAIYNAVQNVVQRCIKAEADLAASQNEVLNLQKKIEDQKDAHIKKLVDKAIADKKFGEDMREIYTNLAKADLEGTKKIIDSLSGVTSVIDRLGEGADDKRKDWTWDNYQKEDPKALAAMKTGNPEQFKALYKAKFDKEPKM